MKKSCFVIAGIICMVLAMGCGSAPAAAPAPVAAAPATEPPWFNDFPPEDVLWGIGTAKQSNDSMSMEFAEMRARQSISRQLSAAVSGMLTDHAEDIGVKNVTQLQERIGRQLNNNTLTGARPLQRWKAPDGTFWYLVEYRKADAAKYATSVVDAEAALYSEYKSSDALARLDAALAASKEKPLVVKE
jgi:hypothetical protein